MCIDQPSGNVEDGSKEKLHQNPDDHNNKGIHNHNHNPLLPPPNHQHSIHLTNQEHAPKKEHNIISIIIFY